MFLAADLTLPMEVWIAVGTAITGIFVWMGKNLLNLIEKQREAHQEFMGLQQEMTDKMIDALVNNSAALTALSERLPKGE